MPEEAARTILDAFAEEKGNFTHTAKRLECSKSSLQRWLARLADMGIDLTPEILKLRHSVSVKNGQEDRDGDGD